MPYKVIAAFIDTRSGRQIEPGEPLPGHIEGDAIEHLVRARCIVKEASDPQSAASNAGETVTVQVQAHRDFTAEQVRELAGKILAAHSDGAKVVIAAPETSEAPAPVAGAVEASEAPAHVADAVEAAEAPAPVADAVEVAEVPASAAAPVEVSEVPAPAAAPVEASEVPAPAAGGIAASEMPAPGAPSLFTEGTGTPAASLQPGGRRRRASSASAE